MREISISETDLSVLLPQAIHQTLFRQAWLRQAPAAAVLPRLLTLAQLLALEAMQKARWPHHPELDALELTLRLQGDAYLPQAYRAPTQFAGRLALARDVLRLREHLAQDAEGRRDSVSSETGRDAEDGAWMLRLAQQGGAAAWLDEADAIESWCAAQRGALALVLAKPPDARQRFLLRAAQRHGLPVLLVQAGFGSAFGLALARASACADAADGMPQALRRPDEERAAGDWADATPQRFSARAARLFAARVQWGAEGTLEAQAQAIVARILARRESQPDTRIAIIALDRRLTRRVNALFNRLGQPVRDEAGWRLSTTRAAAGLQAVLDTWPEDAGSDAVLDLLKQAGVGDAAGLSTADLATLEAEVRAARLFDVHAWRAWAGQQPEAVSRRHALALDHVQRALHAVRHVAGRQSVSSWSQALRDTLDLLGMRRAWQGDAAGRQLLALLASQGDAQPLARTLRVDMTAYVGWLRQAIEAVVFRPEPVDESVGEDRGMPVHVLALHDALLRPWDLCVLAGADAENFPAVADVPGRLGDRACAQLGLPVRSERRRQALRAAALLVLGSRVLAVFEAPPRPDHPGPSPLLQLWRWALGEHAAPPPAPAVGDWRPLLVASHAFGGAQARDAESLVPSSAPRAPDDIPARWSPSAYADLRACPYRFFARRVLRLGEDDDLLPDYSKRDFGNTLHRILERFHREEPKLDPQGHGDLLDRIAAEDWEAAGALAEPFAAVWPAVRDNYLDWLQGWRALGWQTSGEEQAMARVVEQDDAGAALRLEGRIDRIDCRGRERFALDYKTGNPQALKARMQRPGEDTQLLCYALLLGADAPQEPRGAGAAHIGAGYLVVSERRDPEHTDPATALMWAPEALQEQSMLLADQMRRDWRALRAGHAMPALGEPPVCDHCEARGLCRRDHRPAANAAASAQDFPEAP